MTTKNILKNIITFLENESILDFLYIQDKILLKMDIQFYKDCLQNPEINVFNEKHLNFRINNIHKMYNIIDKKINSIVNLCLTGK